MVCVIDTCHSEAEAIHSFKTQKATALEAAISALDYSQEVSHEFLVQAIDDKLLLSAAIESFFNDCSFDITQLKPLKGKIRSFHNCVSMLTRPYIAISDDDYKTLSEFQTDYYQTSGGAVVTFGSASVTGGSTKYAIMPLQKVHADKILSIQ